MSEENTAVNFADSDAWKARVGAFAAAVKADPQAVVDALKGVVGEPSEEALALLADAETAPDSELTAALAPLKIPSALLRRHFAALRGPKAAAPVVGPRTAMSLDVLPAVPDDHGWLEMLKVGGVLKGATPANVIAAMRAGLASRIGLYSLPKKLQAEMEGFAEDSQEPAGAAYYELIKLVTQREYADVFHALGIDGGRFMTVDRKNALLAKLDAHLWDGLIGFHRQVKDWQEAWMSGASNPGLAIGLLAAVGGGAGLPPGMFQPPDTTPLRAKAESVIDSINKIFAGTGVPVTAALGYEAGKIREVLADDRLPALMGVTTREQMLKKLGIGVTSDYVLLERNLTRYALGVLEFPTVESGQHELAYLGAMLQLGAAIPWDTLLSGGKGNRTF